MTVYLARAQLMSLFFFSGGQPRKRFPKVSNNAFGPSVALFYTIQDDLANIHLGRPYLDSTFIPFAIFIPFTLGFFQNPNSE